MNLVGAHVPSADPLGEAAARKADVVQTFLSNPQSWKAPTPREDAAALAASPIRLYVHAPYLVNVASPNNRIRIPSRKILADTLVAAKAVGAAGVIVHGGHVGDDEAVSVGFERWRKALESVEITVPILLENTAGGGNAVLRELDGYGPLWQAIGGTEVGVCIDTCHAWAAGEDLATVVERLRAMTGRIDLIHCNDSRDPLGSHRDRHANLGDGEIPGELLAAVVREAGAPIIVETPGGASEQGADVAWVRAHL
ncbi:MAG TPA: deoxyribonuclease IV [Acidimicrobiia bacterium]